MKPFELLIITARNDEQRWLYQQRLRITATENVARRALVVADPPGLQAGSGGSTVYALCAALDALGIPLEGGEPAEARLAEALRGRKLLLIHCGGLSQRVPPFASLGKAFAPVERGPAGITLFERMIESLGLLAGELPEGVVVACGDALYESPGPASIPPDADAVAWAWPASLEQASRHGVYVWEAVTGQVLRTLQKPSPEELRGCGFNSAAPLDTGVLLLMPQVTAALLGPCGDGRGGPAVRQALRRSDLWQGLDLYADVTHALSCRGARPAGGWRPLLARLGRFNFVALCPEGGRFRHFGTTRELRELLTGTDVREAALINSLVEGETRLGHGAVLNHCLLRGSGRIGDGAFGMGLRSPAQRAPGAILLDDHRVAYQLPVRARSGGAPRDAFVVLGLEDDPKREARPAIFGEPLEDWAGARGLRPADVWDDVPPRERTLWNARVFPVDGPEGLEGALSWLQHAAGRARRAPERLSMREIHGSFNARRWWSYETRLRARVLARAISERLAGDPVAPVEELCRTVPPALAARAIDELGSLARAHDRPLHAARLWRACAALAGSSDLESPYHARAFGAIRKGVTGAAPPRAGSWRLPPGAEVEVRAPVRIDLAGGWTDTPPQAHEWGGAVVNVALLLDGELPVRARARILERPELWFAARDLGQERRCVSLEELRACQDPQDPFALHKAVVLEAGLVGPRAPSLEQALERLGGGLLLETDTRVPKGSGLGTSSILGAAALACARRLSGQDTDWRTLFAAVLHLEQRMTTGGGWQDQIGGLFGGIKLTRTRPGPEQSPETEVLRCAPEVLRALEERLVLFYTGVPRLARNVLQRVVDRYLAREPEAMATLGRMRTLAPELAAALEAGDLSALGAGLSESWELNKRLEPSASNREIEALFQAAAPHVLGAKLAGAGGGGFMVLLARTPGDADLLRELLPRVQPSGDVHPAAVSSRGLALSVNAAGERQAAARSALAPAVRAVP